ncbi:MAG: AAA family ATPase [Candidatus Omnitrophica bacterium]|nr:AAA family ATPase [Candidatus Omnitrophota bacterium]
MNDNVKKIFVGATRQNDGKTIVSLGLLRALLNRFGKVGYIKPVGQQFHVIDGEEIDKDVVLMSAVYKLEGKLKDMSPIAVPKGFTESYIMNPNKGQLEQNVIDSYNRVADGKDIVVIEGTGHAGVGSVFDMSNAEVARILNAPVILVSCGGIGKPIDEIMMNKAMFDAKGVRVLGVVINKVLSDKYNKIDPVVRKGLANQNIEVLGVVPHNEILSSPTMQELLEDTKATLLSGEEDLDNTINRIVVGAMPPHEVLDYLGPGTLLITPGNREDIILAAMSGCLPGVTKTFCISGLVLTCGITPHKNVMHLIKELPIPVLLLKEDTFAVASRIDNLIVKIRPTATRKIQAIEALVEKYVDVGKILDLIKKS